MKVCIIGSRSLDKTEVVVPIINKFFEEQTTPPQVIISGGAKGVDQISQAYAKENSIDLIQFLPYHLIDTTASFNSKYFFVRTKQMISNADKVLAIWNTKSKGTEYGIKLAQKNNIPVMVVKVP